MNPTINHTMLADFYQLTMANGYLEHGFRDREACFDMFFRTVPDGGGFAVMAGVEQLIDYLALLGDNVDNIPGLPGCGPKTAAQLQNAYGSIDGIREHLDDLKPRIRAAFADDAGALERNRSLVRLDDALPENWSGLESIRRRTPDWERLRALAADQGFKSILPLIDKASRPQQQTLGF